MHECPNCGQMCDCDGEDMFHSIPPDDCNHECELTELDPLEYYSSEDLAEMNRQHIWEYLR